MAVTEPHELDAAAALPRREPVTGRWHILVVDDEEDVHAITQLALRRRRWLGREFALEHAASATEATRLLESRAKGHFDVALVDVVMESETAGLDLCHYIRLNQPRHVRIILRTGQPGAAPEEKVLNEYDVDHYLAKAEASRDRLFALIRACLRSGRDIATQAAFAAQLKSFANSLQSISSAADLGPFIREGLGFLEAKYDAACLFFPSLEPVHGASPMVSGGRQPEVLDVEALRHSIRQHWTADTEVGRVHPLSSAPPGSCFVLFTYELACDGENEGDADVEIGALYLEPATPLASDSLASELASDVDLLLENWRIAFRTLALEDRLRRERQRREDMQLERTQALAKLANRVFLVAILAALVLLAVALLSRSDAPPPSSAGPVSSVTAAQPA
jgi:CheY-like chemotaxis protein